MKKTIFLFLLLTVGLASIAQSRNFRDVIYLNDSSIIKGRIHFEGPDSTLFVDTPYGCTFAYTKDKVQRYQLESQMPFQRHKGFMLQSGVTVGKNLFDVNACVDVSFGLAYCFGSIYSLGIGGSCFLYPYRSHSNDYFYNYFSIYLDQRLYFSRKPISPFLEIKTGLPVVLQLVGPFDGYYYSTFPPFYGELGAGLSIRNIDMAICVAGAINSIVTNSISIYTAPIHTASLYIGLRLGFSHLIN